MEMEEIPNQLTPVERLTLQNQFMILAKLYPEQGEDFLQRAKIVEHGFEIEYDTVFGSLRTPLSKEKSEYVLDVLEMYSDLERGFEALKDKDGLTEWSTTFNGFDGNNETDYLAYTRHLKADGKYSNLKKLGENSHGMGSRHNQAMVIRFLEIRDKKIETDDYEPLQADEIRYITQG